VEFSLDWHIVIKILVSLALGGLIGMERQSHYDPEGELESLGLRTFSLAALLGCLSVLAAPFSSAIPFVLGGGYLCLVLAYLYFEQRDRETTPGVTTQVAALLVYVIGALVAANTPGEEPNYMLMGAVLAVLVTSVLSIKDWTHRLVGSLSDEEVLGTIKFLLISVVLLPILPGEPVDPWDIYNPQELWVLVVLISGISFAGYFAIRWFGRERGIALTGALGGLASSTAVTLAMCQRVQNAEADRGVHIAAAFAILVASGIMTLRVLVLVFAVSVLLAEWLWMPMGAMATPGLIAAGVFWWMIEEPDESVPDGGQEDETSGDDELEIDNPFELAPALKFGLLFAVIIGVVHVAETAFGSSWTYLAAFLSGLANMDAISVTMARMTESESIASVVATRGVVIAIVANSLSKAVMAAGFGSLRLGAYVAAGLVPTIGVGLWAVFLL